MKKHLLKILLFLCILVMPSLIWLALKAGAPNLHASLVYDLGENRNPAKAPTVREILFSGDKIDPYYSDRAPFRSPIISFYRSWDEKTEHLYDHVILPGLTAFLYGGSTDSEKEFSSGAYDSLFGDGSSDSSNAPETDTDASATDPEADAAGEESTDCVHNWQTVAEQPATCTEDGWQESKCDFCQMTQTREQKAAGHDWEILNTVEASYITYGYTECRCKVCAYTEKLNFTNKLIDDSYMAPKTVGEGTIIGRSGWLFLSGYGNLPYYRATNLLSEEEMQDYLDKLVALQTLCDEKGIKLGILFGPNKDQVYSEYMPSYTVEDEYKRTRRFVDFVTENSDIAIAYPLEELKSSDRYWQVYYKYDTHWNDMGGFIGLQALYQQMGYPVTNPLTLEIEKIPSKTAGDLFGLGSLDPANYPADEEYLIHYKEDVIVESKGDVRASNIYRSTSNSTNPENLVWLGDSYRAMNIPYLERDFASCVVIHRDYIESIVNDIKNADVIVLSAVERYDSRIFKTVDRLIEILSE